VDYTGGYSTFSLARFGQKFVDQVANPRNILCWYQHREPTTLSKFLVLFLLNKPVAWKGILRERESAEIHQDKLMKQAIS